MPDPAGERPRPEDDPLARRSPVLFWLFGWYLRWYFWWRFHAVRVSRSGLPDLPPGRPVIVFTNHPSWWDPALFILLGTLLLPNRPGFGPMDQAALGRYGVLERMGVFGIDLASRSGAARFLAVGRRVLSMPGAMLWITAEGHFTDPRLRPVRLRPGIAHLARRSEGVVLVPLAVEYGFWNESKPEALARFGPPIEAGGGRSVAEWSATLEAALAATMDALAAESARRDPADFHRLLGGRSGVGGIYDTFNRLRALLRFRRFDPSHGAATRPETKDR